MGTSHEHMLDATAATPVVEITSFWPYSISIMQADDGYGFDIVAKDSDFIGQVGPKLSHRPHRALAVLRAVQNHTKFRIAGNLLKIQDWFEGPLLEEEVSGYDLIYFYLKRGMVPAEEMAGCERLKNKLANYVHQRRFGGDKINSEQRHALPMISIIQSEPASRVYLAELEQRISVLG